MIVLAMPLNPGTRAGPYEILSSIGAGGMGEVYRARDTRLNREVAVKVLPQSLAADHDRLRRFTLEAQSAGALNHPNILAIFDIGTHDGAPYLVSELLEGESLRARLRAGKLSVPKAVEYARQVASGLAAAHAKGITHRDVKPENLFITRDGHVKILDFGLAKVRSAARTETQATQTLETNPGVVMGTVAYMSPEQVRGEAVDHRSDIFSVGCVLYEMLSGRRPFEGATSVETMNAILKEVPPELTATGETLPPALERVVRHCLEKLPEERFQSARDLAFDLEALSQVSARVEAKAHPIEKWKAAAVGSAVVAVLALAVAVAAILWPRPEPALRPSMRLSITLPDDAPLAPGGSMQHAQDRPALALSPDGSRLAYVALIAGKTQLCLREMSTGKITPLAGTVGGHSPFFSPDSNSIGFFADGKLKWISSGGGPATVLADAPSPMGGAWGTNNTIYFNRVEGEGVLKISLDGGPVQTVADGQLYHPALPGRGRGLLATSGATTIYLEGTQRHRLVRGFGARWTPTGHLVYAVHGKLMAATFDPSRVETAGSSVTLFEDLRTGPFGVAQFAFSQDGPLIYAPGRSQQMSSFVWVDRKGRARPLGLPDRLHAVFALSPDGKRLALTALGEGAGTEIWVFDLLRGSMSRLSPREQTGNPASNSAPFWTPDSRHVIYSRSQGSSSQLVSVPADGSAGAVVLWSRQDTGLSYLNPSSFSPDGSVLVTFGVGKDTSLDIYLIRLKNPRTPPESGPEPFLKGAFSEAQGQISPDGRWMLYGSDQSGRWECYVTSYPKPGSVHQISRSGMRDPRWNRSGTEILYMEGTGLYAVDVTPGPEFRAGEPRLLFEGPYVDVPGFSFDISPDGQEFLMLENKDILTPSKSLTVVTNFFDELRRRVPAGRGR